MLKKVERLDRNKCIEIRTSMKYPIFHSLNGISNSGFLVCNKSSEGYVPYLGVNRIGLYDDYIGDNYTIANVPSKTYDKFYRKEKYPKYVTSIFSSSFRDNIENVPNFNSFLDGDYFLPIVEEYKNFILNFITSPIFYNVPVFRNIRPRYSSINIEELLFPFVNTTDTKYYTNSIIGGGVFSIHAMSPEGLIKYCPIIHLEIKKEYISYCRLAYIMNKPISTKFFKLNIINKDNFPVHLLYYLNLNLENFKSKLEKIQNLDWGEIEIHSKKSIKSFYGKDLKRHKISINKKKEFNTALIDNFIKYEKIRLKEKGVLDDILFQ